MRRMLLGLVLFLAACSPESSSLFREEEGDVKAFFEGWRQAQIDGRFDDVFAGMSVRMRTLWVWHLYQNRESEVARGQRDQLSPALQELLDTWMGRNLTREEGQVDLLPPELRQGEWLKETLKRQYAVDQARLSEEFRGLKIVRAAVDATGATVVVSNRGGAREMYSCMRTGEGWCVDGYRGSLRRAP